MYLGNFNFVRSYRSRLLITLPNADPGLRLRHRLAELSSQNPCVQVDVFARQSDRNISTSPAHPAVTQMTDQVRMSPLMMKKCPIVLAFQTINDAVSPRPPKSSHKTDQKE